VTVHGPRSLSRNAAWALLGNVGYAACQWGVLLVIAKHAPPEEVGRFALGVAIAGPVIILTNLQLRAVQATDARHATPFGVYLGLRLVGVMVALPAILLLTLAGDHDPATLRLVAALALAKGVEAVADVVFGLQQQAENLRRIALSMLVKGVGSLIAVAGCLAATGSVVVAVLGMAAWWTLVLVIVDLRGAARLARLRPSFDAARLAPLAWTAMPLGLVMGLNSFAVNVPRYAIAASLGPKALGYFAAAAYLLLAATQVMLALGAALSPRLARLHMEDRAAYRELTLRTLAIAAAVAAAGVAIAALAGGRLLALAYAPEYAAQQSLLVWLAAVSGVGLLSTQLGVAVTAARRFSSQLAIAGAALVACAATSAMLVPRYGLVGAALALLTGELVRAAALAVIFGDACRTAPDGCERPSALRVLHVFGTMNRGGAETRTLEIMRRLQGAGYHFDYCVLGGARGALAPEIERLGGEVVECALRPGLPTFPFRFWRLLRRRRYDAVHSHVYAFSGVILALARLAGARVRIAHIRTAPAAGGRLLYRTAMRRLLAAAATAVIGVSESALAGFFGPAWRRDPRRRLIYDGVDPARFEPRDGDSALRSELAIPHGARLVLQIGSFSPAKNHACLGAVATALARRRSDVVFVLVGEGALRAEVEREIAARGLTASFRFTGARDDVARLLATADLVILPSRWEGLPGVVLEALAAGVPVVASPIAPVRELAAWSRGIVVADPSDAEAFAAAIDTVLDIPPAAADVGLPPRFTLDASLPHLLECYR